MKLGTVVNAVPALQKLAGENLTPKTLYWVSKLLSKLDTEIDFYNEERRKIVTDLGKEVETEKWEIPADNREEFNRRMTDLLNVDIDVEFKVVQIPTSEELKLCCNDIRLMDGFVELVLVDDTE